MTVLVTGAAGFMGSHVAESLLERGHEVIALDDLSGGFRENVPRQAIFHQGSILDTALLDRIFSEHRIEHVYHLAAYAAEGLSHFIRRFNYTNNIVGSVNLLNCAIRSEVRCFVFTSSIAVYGSSQVPMTEATIPHPEDPYGIAKRAVELDLEAARRIFGTNYIIFRPHNVYGERQNIGDRYRNVIGIFMNQLMRGEPMTIFGDGGQSRNFTYIQDVAPLLAQAIETPAAWNSIYNLGSSEVTTVKQLAEMVAGVMHKEPRMRFLPAREEVKHALADHSRVAQAFDYQPRWSLPEGLERMARWAEEVGQRSTPPFRDIEVTRNLPASWTES
jgi:UDP-glucose 4-epimerase